MLRISTSGDVAAIEAGTYGLSLAAHLRARSVEHRILDFIGPSAANGFGPTCRFRSGTRPLARDLSAVLARFQPSPLVRRLDRTVLP